MARREVMKEYQSRIIPPDGFNMIANGEAKDGWRVVTVLPHEYVDRGPQKTLVFLNVIFERDRNAY